MLALAVLACGDVARAQDDHRQRQVLVLHSNRRDAEISTLIDRELPRLLDDGTGLDYYSEYIDLPRFSDDGYQTAFRNFLRLKYQGVRFDLVVAMQDSAIAFLREHRNDLFGDTPIVFLANHPPAAMPNATGVVIRLRFEDTVDFAKTLQPAIRHVFVVSGAAASDKVLEAQARAQFEEAHSGLSFVYLSGLPTKELEARLKRLPWDSIVYVVLVYQDGDGEKFRAAEYEERIAAMASAPTYTWVDATMGRGIVGGSLASLQAELDAVADVSRRVLAGESASAIPVATPDVNVRQADWRQLRRWNISEALLPAGTLVRFKGPDVWDRFKNYIVVGAVLLLAQSLLIGGLLIQGRHRRRAEARTRDLGGRLLRAHEEERARIARELHDDVSQQLALLTFDLDLLRTAPRDEVDGWMQDAFERAKAIATNIDGVLRRLHPTRLKLLGLIAALEGLRRELSQPAFTIDFAHQAVPDMLPDEIGLCVFRVAQEALQNALKHSHAHHVSMHLRGDGHILALTISDDGAGFNVNAAWGTGLGLVSMRERLELVDGTLRIHSENGVGTSLTATVPASAALSAAAAPSSLRVRI